MAAAVALVFGLLTLKSGGAVLFFDGPARQAAGHYMPFVLWFNFLAGFAYVAAAAGLWLGRRWAAPLAAAIAALTLLVFAAFGVAIALDVPHEPRTIGAMTLRAAVWLAIAVLAYRTRRRMMSVVP